MKIRDQQAKLRTALQEEAKRRAKPLENVRIQDEDPALPSGNEQAFKQAQKDAQHANRYSTQQGEKVRDLQRELEETTAELDLIRAENEVMREQAGSASQSFDKDKLGANMKLFRLARICERMLENMNAQQNCANSISLHVGGDGAFSDMTWDDVQNTWRASRMNMTRDGGLEDVTSLGNSLWKIPRGSNRPSSLTIESTIPASVAIEFIRIVDDLKNALGEKGEPDEQG